MNAYAVLIVIIILRHLAGIIVLAGTTYLVFGLNHSGWWMALAAPLSVYLFSVEAKVKGKGA